MHLFIICLLFLSLNSFADIKHSRSFGWLSSQWNDDKIVLGWIEKIKIHSTQTPLKAKLDTGAKTSSIYAEIVKIHKQDKQEFVLYRIPTKQEPLTFESEIIRWAKIKTKQGGIIRRPVVHIDFCIGNQIIRGEVNLANRSHFNYPVLIGRNMLKDHIIVDANKTFSKSAECKS